MAASRRPSVESLITASAFLAIGAVGGWAAGLWDAEPEPAPQPPTRIEAYGPSPETDARAGVPDVCSRRIGCLVR
jgi:hypothetical protein